MLGGCSYGFVNPNSPIRMRNRGMPARALEGRIVFYTANRPTRRRTEPCPSLFGAGTDGHPEAPDRRPLGTCPYRRRCAKRAFLGRGRISRPRVAKSRESPSSGRICVPRDAYPATPHETRRATPKQSSQDLQNARSENLIATSELHFRARMPLGNPQIPSEGDFATLPRDILPGGKSRSDAVAGKTPMGSRKVVAPSPGSSPSAVRGGERRRR